MALPSNPSNGDFGTLNGNQFIFNGATQSWVLYKSIDVISLENRVDSDLTNFRFNDLSDVNVSYPPENNTILSWDSDNQQWVSKQFTNDPLGAIAVRNQKFVISNSETSFRLKFFPLGDVVVIRNGINLPIDSYSVSGRFVTYTGSVDLENGDELTIRYNYGTSAALTTELANLTDVDVVTNLPKQGEVLSWDSDNEVFKPTDLEPRLKNIEDDLLQVSSDRIFTDNLLSNRINNLDSDLNARGSFYVQADPPPGSANSGWVNLNDMKLYFWDTRVETWTQIALT
jgi:hypothetical protein